VSHLLVTNDFPPKVGGIQNLLYEYWRRLPSDEITVLTTRHDGSDSFDRAQPFRVVRVPSSVLLPTPALAHRIRALADETHAGLVVLDPALPLGLVGRRIGRPYAVLVHGAEVTVPGRMPFTRQLLEGVLRPARMVVAFSDYSAAEARRVIGSDATRIVTLTPGVDAERFRPLSQAEIAATREHFGLPVDGRLVVSVSRLVPRKGMDVLIEAVGRLSSELPDLCLAIGGQGRDRRRLEERARRLEDGRGGAAGRRRLVHLLGRVADEDLPLLDGAADVWAMLCRDRWLGLEQEGFGIVFLEAAATGVPQVAGRSGGSHEAVLHGVTGLVVDHPSDPVAVAAALADMFGSAERRGQLGAAARRRVEEHFTYDRLVPRLHAALREAGA
jgi:phosphatidyl-myo-inositol dimannoside synthase